MIVPGSSFALERSPLLLLLVLTLHCSMIWAQPADCLDERPGHIIRSIKIEARYVPASLVLPVKRGDEFTPDKVRTLRRAVTDALQKEKDKHEVELTVLGKLPLVDLSFVRACGLPAPPATCQAEGLTDKCTDVVVRVYALSVDALSLGSGLLLPFPRSNKFTFLSSVPRPLRIFNPKFGITQDQKLGTMPKLSTSTDLMALHKLLDNESVGAGKTALLLKAEGGRSLNKQFYTSQVSLQWTLRQPTEQVESFGLATNFTADHLPQKEDQYWQNAFRIGGHVALNPTAGIVNRLVLNAAYRRSGHRLIHPRVTDNIQTAEHSLEGRALLEGHLKNDFFRAAVWFDGGKPAMITSSYQRVAATFGYTIELPVGEHTIGVEALVGAGYGSAQTPEYARFYGGNTLNNFLYEDLQDQNFVAMPSGPLLRSAGRNQAGINLPGGLQRGGNSFQHFNLTASLPLPGLAFPLIPKEQVTPNATLRTLIKDFAVDSAVEVLSDTLQGEGLSRAEADKKAAKIFKQIRPGINYLADYAKVFALKPLVMFDAARLTRPGNLDAQTRYAFGGGLQLTVVVAKFEIGYMYAVHRYNGDPHGNFVARLVFQNLF